MTRKVRPARGETRTGPNRTQPEPEPEPRARVSALACHSGSGPIRSSIHRPTQAPTWLQALLSPPVWTVCCHCALAGAYLRLRTRQTSAQLSHPGAVFTRPPFFPSLRFACQFWLSISLRCLGLGPDLHLPAPAPAPFPDGPLARCRDHRQRQRSDCIASLWTGPAVTLPRDRHERKDRLAHGSAAAAARQSALALAVGA